MPTLYSLKPAFQERLRPLVGRLARRGVTPNQLTLATLAGCMALGGALVLTPDPRPVLALYPLALFLRMVGNALDGMLAREHGLATRTGAVLNEVGDVVADLALYLPLARIAGVPPLPLLVAVGAGVLTEAAALAARRLGGTRRYDGPLGKSDRAVAFGALALALALGLHQVAIVGLFLGLLTKLALATAALRLHRGLEGRAA